MSGHHDHHRATGHAHGSGNKRAVGVAAALTGIFMLAEVAGGIFSNSLALLADAGHMLADLVALLLAWFGFRLAERPADWKHTYGYDRFSVLAAFVNGMALFVIAGWICYEAWVRLSNPDHVLGGLMMWVALAGLVVNIASFWVLTRQATNSLNIRAAALHVMGDLLGSVAALAAALVIIFTGWSPIDPILSVFVALIILRSAWRVVRESSHILLEGAPDGLDRREMARLIETTVPGVVRVHHVHAWSITDERPMATLEAEIDVTVDLRETRQRIKTLVHEHFGIGHTTVEIDQPPQPAE